MLSELEKAELLFPDFPTDAVHAAAIVNEEAGELQRAALQYYYQDAGELPMILEAMQTGAMAIRFLINVDKLKKRNQK